MIKFDQFMEDYKKARPKKAIFSLTEQARLRSLAVQRLKDLLLPDDSILGIVLIGSSVKGEFGKYDPPGFRGSMYSDFDFIIFVKDDYEVPSDLIPEPDGKPFKESELNLAYRIRNFVENKYDAEIFFVRESTVGDPLLCAEGERAGIPVSKANSTMKIIFYTPDNSSKG